MDLRRCVRSNGGELDSGQARMKFTLPVFSPAFERHESHCAFLVSRHEAGGKTRRIGLVLFRQTFNLRLQRQALSRIT